MLLVLGPTDGIQPTLRTFLDSLHDKNSANYHRWLTPEQFGERFGPSQADLIKIAAWLQQQGFDSIKVSPGRSHIQFSGSVQTLERAFQTQMHSYRSGGGVYLANNSDIAIPKALAGIVRGAPLETFSFTKPALTRAFGVHRVPDGQLVEIAPTYDSQGMHFLSPGDYANIYDIGSLYASGTDGLGETIAVVARSNISLADVETFRRAFNLLPNDPNIIVDGTDPGFLGVNSDAIEASLDAQWAGAIAPNATVDVVISASSATTDGVFLSAIYIVDNNLADVMSVSFESCEQNLGASNFLINTLWQQAAAQGISVFVAAGDQGAAGCDPNSPSASPAQGGLGVNGLASTPFNTAVGGTQFSDTVSPSTYWASTNGPGEVSALGYIPEAVWNESCGPATCDYYSFDAGGGGVSTLYTKPSWQSTSILGVPNDGHRDVPDVSLSAAVHDSYVICVSGYLPCTLTGSGNQLTLGSAGTVAGTSAASPSFAGIMALVDQKQGGRQGLANYVLYRLAASETFANCNSSNQSNPSTPPLPACVFNDVTDGNNGVPGNDILTGTVPPGDVVGQLGYNALPGYDSASGLGSVNAANLVTAWNSANFQASATTLIADGPTSVQHGQPVPFSVTVSALSGGNGSPGGDVSLVANEGQSVFSAGKLVGSGVLANGVSSFSVGSLPGGTYGVVAHYPGDGTFGGSTSNPVQVTVTPENSSVALSVFNLNRVVLPSPVSQPYGAFFAVHAAVTSASGNGVATGIVTFSDGGTPIAQVPLNSAGEAELFDCIGMAFCLTIGQHSITASYSGDNSLNAASSGTAIAFNISIGTPLLIDNFVGMGTLGSPPGSLVVEQFGAQFLYIGSIPPTGTITFFDNFNGSNGPLGPPIPLNSSGNIPIEGFSLPPGAHSITLQYPGDKNYSPATSLALPLDIAANGELATQTQLTLLTPTISVGQMFTVTVAVTSNSSQTIPTGQVYLYNNAGFTLNGALQTSTLTNGSATMQAIMPSAASNIFVAYEGDSTFAPGLSNQVPISVAKATPQVSVKSYFQYPDPNRQDTLLATITPPAGAFSPDGTVQFFDSFDGGQSVPLGLPQSLQPSLGLAFPGQSATAAIPVFLPLGTHVLTASYSGNNNYNAVPSSQPVTVNADNSQTITFPALPNTVIFGVAPITLQATATSGLPVSYSATGPASISGSALTILDAGTVIVTANQAGSATFAPAPPMSQTITVNPQADAGFTLSPSARSLTIQSGKSGTVTITVTPSGGFDNQVSFSCVQSTLAMCSFTPQTLTPGTTPVTTTLMVTASSTVAQLRVPAERTVMPLALAFGSMFASLAMGIVLTPTPVRIVWKSKIVQVLCGILLGLAIAFQLGCGSAGSSSSSGSGGGGGGNPQSQTGVVAVSASAAGNSGQSFSLTVTVTP